MKKTFDLKEDCKIEDMTMLHPNLIVMFGTVLQFAASRDLPVVITSIISDRKNVQAVSRTHEEGRALDLSVRGWRDSDIKDLIRIINAEHDHIGAISAKTYKPSPVVFHDVGHGAHFHFQVRP